MTKPFQNEGRDSLRTPEHLDRALYVTTAKAWLALCVLMVMTVAVIIWAILGEVSTYVKTEGIILSREGMVFDAVSVSGGTLMRIIPAIGDNVAKEGLVAEIFNAETMERYISATALAEQSAQTLKDRESEAREENALVLQNIVKQRERLVELERTGRELVDKARQRLQDDQALLAQGMIDRMAVERSEQALDLALRNLFDAMSRREGLEADELRRRNNLKARVNLAKSEHLKAKRRVSELATLIETGRIRAPVSGRVTEVKAQVGATLGSGESVISIETGGEGLDVLIYVSPLDGKRVKVGLPALVSPATVRREKYGSMLGSVESLSEFPASLNGMIAVLQNQDLAKTFSRDGPPYPGRVALTLDSSTTSGFAWTSPHAVDVKITPGTLATVEVKVSSEPPIALAVPWIKEKLDL